MTFVVRNNRTAAKDKWIVRISEVYAHLFKYPHNDGTCPGWLSTVSFDTWDDAVDFGFSIEPHILQAQHFRTLAGDELKTVNNLINKERD